MVCENYYKANHLHKRQFVLPSPIASCIVISVHFKRKNSANLRNYVWRIRN